MNETIEIACDESGSEGERLTGGSTEVFAYASIRMSRETAAACVRAMRERAPSPALEYKAHLILREKHAHALAWLLDREGPLYGRSRVYLVDKAYLLVRAVARIAATGAVSQRSTVADSLAVVLCTDGPRALGAERWLAFLHAANDLLRLRNRRRAEDGTGEPVAAFLDSLRKMAAAASPDPMGKAVQLLLGAGGEFRSYREHCAAAAPESSPLEMLGPALAHSVRYWTDGKRNAAVIHDHMNVITEAWTERVRELLARFPATGDGDSAAGGLARITVVDSREDPRIQVADVLAGVARRLATEELSGRGDPHLTALLSSFVDPRSVWSDPRSGAALGLRPICSLHAG